jgi:serine/threonine protein kinase
LDGNLSFKVDIWSFGCVLLEFGSGIRPYDMIENDVALSMTIFRGLNPLDYAMGSDKAD